jgi:hypothetical protein
VIFWSYCNYETRKHDVSRSSIIKTALSTSSSVWFWA